MPTKTARLLQAAAAPAGLAALATIGVVAVAEVLIFMNESDDRAGGVFIGLLVAFGSAVVAGCAARLGKAHPASKPISRA